MGGAPGSGLVIPLTMIFFKLDSKNAVALSNMSICVSSLIRYLLFAREPHPLKNGKGRLID